MLSVYGRSAGPFKAFQNGARSAADQHPYANTRQKNLGLGSNLPDKKRDYGTSNASRLRPPPTLPFRLRYRLGRLIDEGDDWKLRRPCSAREEGPGISKAWVYNDARASSYDRTAAVTCGPAAANTQSTTIREEECEAFRSFGHSAFQDVEASTSRSGQDTQISWKPEKDHYSRRLRDVGHRQHESSLRYLLNSDGICFAHATLKKICYPSRLQLVIVTTYAPTTTVHAHQLLSKTIGKDIEQGGSLGKDTTFPKATLFSIFTTTSRGRQHRNKIADLQMFSSLPSSTQDGCGPLTSIHRAYIPLEGVTCWFW
ncbi:hypothetical protein G7K_6699-t1 [Saitoella complicata NRRL Y-17804]|uniref:Uncharacterized protein n=1 Tax=Saitoella complicata (strain BCRC 22490 / CBS 7301 / JCM 7358 / NBRC 10748 / NRRL Y-17804) TaxID=698492 RepID=A0A0E9NSI4_SAICN|nr:hypothetical protein G7K_6699-t1 [Saitoella complicata NRRL Y-17804]